MAFKAPVEQVISQLCEMIKAEFTTHYAYKAYAQSFRDLSRNSVAEEFEEHAEDEMDHADFLLQRLVVLNGDAPVPSADAPPPFSDPADIIAWMVDLEEKGIEKWKTLVDMVGDDPTCVTAEEYMAKELEHSDDLKQLLPPENVMNGDALPAVDDDSALTLDDLAAFDETRQEPLQGKPKFMPPSPAFLLSSIAARIVEAQERESKVVKEKGKYCVRSENNPDWSGGCYDTKAEADKRLNQVEMFKHMNKG